LALIALVCLIVVVIAIVVIVVVAVRKSSTKSRWRGRIVDEASANAGVLNKWQQLSDKNYTRHVPQIEVIDTAASTFSIADKDNIKTSDYSRTFVPMIIDANDDDETASCVERVADAVKPLTSFESANASLEAPNSQIRLTKGLSMYPSND
jgi:hypothetical protein